VTSPTTVTFRTWYSLPGDGFTVYYTPNQQNCGSSSSSSSSSTPQAGCIDVLKEAFDPTGNQLSTVPQFNFSVDGTPAGSNDSTGRLHIVNVTQGNHTVTESLPSGWTQFLVTPANGAVTVAAGNACTGITFKNQQNAISSSSSSSQASITDVSITKTANPVTVTQGGTTQFTVTVTNNGPSAAQNVVVNDPLPSGLAFSSVTTTLGSYSGNLWTIGSLNNGQSATMQLSAIVNTTSSVTNVATVSTSTQENNYGNNVASATVSTSQIQQNGCVDVFKTAVDSNGNGIGNVPSFTFSLDGNQTQTNDSSGHAHFSNVSIGTHTITEYQQSGWNMVSMNPAGGNVTVSNGSCAAVYVRNQQTGNNNNIVNFQVTKDDGRSQVQPGDSLTYTITIRNQNGTNANNVTATDTLPNGETAISASNGGIVGSQYVTWNNIYVPAYGTVTLTVTATVNQNANGSLTNQVNVGGAVAFDTDTVQATSNSLTLSKSASTSEVFPGGMIEYTVQLQNTGNGNLTNVRATDNLPANVTVVDAGGGNTNGNQITWNIGTLAANSTRTLNYRISLGSFYQPGQIVTNNVTATADNGVNQQASATVQVIGNLPQTGWMNADLGGPSPFLHPINALVKQAASGGSGNGAGLPMTIWVSLAGLATGVIGGVGRKFFTGI
jgi:uncharacterized repeat protein (TIGR01451 family)